MDDKGRVDLEGSARVVELERQIADLKLAVESQQRIGVCVGLLCSQLDCTPVQAWGLLVWLSQNTNTKLRTVAQVLVDRHCHTLSASDVELADELRQLLPPARRAVSSGHGRRQATADSAPRKAPNAATAPDPEPNHVMHVVNVAGTV